MKKFLSFFLTLAIVASLCSSLAGCSKVTEGKMEDDPAATLSEAFENTADAFFDGGVGIYDVLNKMDGKASLEMYFESDDLLGDDLTRVSFTAYTDTSKNKAVADLGAVYEGKALAARAYLDEKGVILSGSSVFGTDSAYGFFYDSFISRFASSELARMMELDDEDISSAVEYIENIRESFNKKRSEAKKDAEELGNELCMLLEQAITVEKVEVGEKKHNCIVVKYQITNKTVRAIAEKVYDELLKDGDVSGELHDEMTFMLEELDAEYDLDFGVSVALIKSSNKIANISVKGDVAQKDLWDESVSSVIGEIGLDIDLSDDKINITAAASSDGEERSVDISIRKQKDGKDVTYSMDIVANQGSKSIDVFFGSVAFKNEGELEIDAELMASEFFSTEIEIRGRYKAERNKASVQIDSVKVGNAKVRFTLGLAVDADPDMPNTPENAEDVVNFDEAKWNELINGIESSDIAKLFENIGQ